MDILDGAKNKGRTSCPLVCIISMDLSEDSPVTKATAQKTSQICHELESYSGWKNFARPTTVTAASDVPDALVI